MLGVCTHFKDAFVVNAIIVAVNDCTVPKTRQMYFLEYSFFSEQFNFQLYRLNSKAKFSLMFVVRSCCVTLGALEIRAQCRE